MLIQIHQSDALVLYRRQNSGKLCQLIASTPQTRAICNDPQVAGIDYTRSLAQSCTAVLREGNFALEENATVVVNILRGGLNFGLREALADAFHWHCHTTCFLSAQRARDDQNPESWHITENAYRKLYFPRETSFVIGDVVATGTSLRYALAELIREAKNAGAALQSILFFTFGGEKAAEILAETDAQCREFFPHYRGTTLVFFEGCFTVPTTESPLTIRLTGTDLVRFHAEMAPEFIASQYECPAYPIERCVIYDAGSRAFYVREYANDVASYWKEVLNLAGRGISFADYLHERFPELDVRRFGDVSLQEVALRQLEKIRPFCG